MITCGECGKEISDKAANCVGCGSPVATLKEEAAVRTVQETAKPLKAQQAIAMTVFALGMFSLFILEPGSDWGIVAVAATVIGLFGYIWSKMQIWWHHK
jgi:hypothetical protein